MSVVDSPVSMTEHHVGFLSDVEHFSTGRMGWHRWLIAAQVWFSVRLGLVILSTLTGVMFEDVLRSVPSLATLWGRWDSAWYVRLATQGYQWHGVGHQSTLAFFPLYSLSIRVLMWLIPISPFLAGVVISNVCAYFCLVALHYLTEKRTSVEVADRVVWLFGVFPTAFFFLAVYSEAMYLMWCLGAFIGLFQRRWLLAGLCAALAALTRQLGILLFVPFVIEGWYAIASTPPALRLAHLRPIIGGIAVFALGPLSFITYLWLRFRNPLLFLQAQHSWNRVLAWPWDGTLAALQRIGLQRYSQGLRTITIIDLITFGMVILLIVIGARKLPLSYTLYSAAIWLAVAINPSLTHHAADPLLSVSRFAVTLFPPFITLGLLTRHRAVERSLFTVSVTLLALFTITFIRSRWVA